MSQVSKQTRLSTIVCCSSRFPSISVVESTRSERNACNVWRLGRESNKWADLTPHKQFIYSSQREKINKRCFTLKASECAKWKRYRERWGIISLTTGKLCQGRFAYHVINSLSTQSDVCMSSLPVDATHFGKHFYCSWNKTIRVLVLHISQLRGLLIKVSRRTQSCKCSSRMQQREVGWINGNEIDLPGQVLLVDLIKSYEAPLVVDSSTSSSPECLTPAHCTRFAGRKMNANRLRNAERVESTFFLQFGTWHGWDVYKKTCHRDAQKYSRHLLRNSKNLIEIQTFWIMFIVSWQVLHRKEFYEFGCANLVNDFSFICSNELAFLNI